jgi:hypothetical protein
MIQSIVFPLTAATVVCQELQAIAVLSSQPCLCLREQMAALAARFLVGPITPVSTLDFEKDLRQILDECGRLVLQSVFNHIEPAAAGDAPTHTQRDRQDYCRKNQKSPTRGGIATLFGRIELQRCLYEPLQEGRDDGQRSFAPLELCLGIVANNATPALAERVGRLSSKHTQQEMLDLLHSDHHVKWSPEVLRNVAAAVSAGIASHLLEAQKRQVLRWLARAFNSRGRRRPTLSVGRDGIMLPIRHEKKYKEGGVATISVLDRRGRRVGTIYLAEMPEAGQVTLSGELTALLKSVLAGWQGPMPRLVYVTDAGYHPTTYFEEVLTAMENPHRPGECLQWMWIVDFYHAAEYVGKLAQLLFNEEKTRQAWARRMRHLMRDKERGVLRVLASAAQYHGKTVLNKKEEKAYEAAYSYLLKHSNEMHYSKYKRAGLPLGSGITEAGCKVVFTQRFKESGMTWSLKGGEVILRLRLAELSGVWDEVYQEYLKTRPLAPLATQLPSSAQTDEKAA